MVETHPNNTPTILPDIIYASAIASVPKKCDKTISLTNPTALLISEIELIDMKVILINFEFLSTLIPRYFGKPLKIISCASSGPLFINKSSTDK